MSKYLFFCIFFCFACVREHTIHVPVKTPNQLAIIALLSPQVISKVYVSRIIPNDLNTNYNQYLESAAIVRIEDKTNGVRSSILRLETPGVYAIDTNVFKIISGHTYLVSVSHTQFKTAYGETTIPIKRAVWDTISLFRQSGTAYLQVKGRWHNILGVSSDFFAVDIYSKQFQNVEFASYNNFYLGLDGFNYLKNDVTVNYKSNATNQIIANLFHMDEFMRSYVLQLNVEANLRANDYTSFVNIIGAFKGITPASSNVVNGVGVVGSYLLDTKEFLYEAN